MKLYLNAGSYRNPDWRRQFTFFNDYEYRMYSAFADINGDDLTDVICGNKVFVNTGRFDNPSFEIDSALIFPDEYYYSPVAAGDIDSDGDTDILYGSNGITLLENTGAPANPHFFQGTARFGGIEILPSYSPLTLHDFDFDGDLDLYAGTALYENTGDAQNAVFQLKDAGLLSPFPPDLVLKPVFADIDRDGDFDFIPFRNGEESGGPAQLLFIENRGTAHSADWRDTGIILAEIGYFYLADYEFADLDGDGDLDLLTVVNNRVQQRRCFYRNTGSVANPQFTLESFNFWQPENALYYSRFELTDIDRDGDFDILQPVTAESDPSLQTLALVENVGSPYSPEFRMTRRDYLNESFPYIFPLIADFDADGDCDIYINYTIYSPYQYEPSETVRIYFRNDGAPWRPLWRRFEGEPAGLPLGSGLGAADLDGDKLPDVFAGHVGLSNGALRPLHQYRCTGFSPDIPFRVESALLPGNVSLFAYPNPFNRSVTINFRTTVIGRVKLALYDITGRETAVLADAYTTPGVFSCSFNGSNLASGVYFVRLSEGNLVQISKLLLLK